jgi:hypothetical protein
VIAILLRLVLWGVSLASIATFAMLAFLRLFHPLELDCIEGVMMDHIVRLAQGRPIYVEPSLSYIPLSYMPFYAAVSSLLARAFGPALWEPRLVSMLSAFGIAAVVMNVLRAETRSWTLGLAGAALYLLGFGITGSCYDVARPDSLMLLLAFGGLLVLRHTTGGWGAVAGALLLVVAFFTKQHAAMFLLAALVHMAFNDRRRLPVFALTLFVGCGGGYGLLQLALGPWFSFYTWEVPSHWSQFSRIRLFNYLSHGVFGSLALLTIASLLSLAVPERPWRGPSGIWAWATLGALGTGVLATLDPYAYRHVLSPTMVALSIMGPLSLHRVALRLVAGGGNRTAAVVVPTLLLVLQFVPLVYPVRRQLPRPGGTIAHAVFMYRLHRLPGPVLMPYHGYYSWSAGRGSSLQIIALEDIMRSRGNRLLRSDPHYVERLFRPLREGSHRPAIVTDVPLSASGSPWNTLEASYQLADTLGWLSEALRPVSGNPFTPSYIYLPREGGHVADGAASPQPARRHASVSAAHVP